MINRKLTGNGDRTTGSIVGWLPRVPEMITRKLTGNGD